MVVPLPVQQLTLLVERAHQLHQFAINSSEHPEQAWESVADLCELLDQLQQVYPPKFFRPHHS
jgi:hypothetical protein